MKVKTGIVGSDGTHWDATQFPRLHREPLEDGAGNGAGHAVGHAVRNGHCPETAPDAPPVDRETETDVSRALRLLVIARDAARYSEPEKKWYVYDGTRWQPGSSNLVIPFVHQLALDTYAMALTFDSRDLRKYWTKEAAKLEADAVIRAVINQAKALTEFKVDPLVFDQDPDTLNVRNGTIDLRTGKLRPHDPLDLISKVAPVDYDPEAKSELWEQTVQLVMGKLGAGGGGGSVLERDEEMEQYLARRSGYALSGHTYEKEFGLDQGARDTGKSTVNTSLEAVLGPDYATTMRPEALFASKEPVQIPHEIATLHGKRLVLCPEVPTGRRFNEAMLKAMTGGERLSACFKYANSFTFKPMFYLVLYSNHLPDLSGGDDALWLRARCIPYRFSFAEYGGRDETAIQRLKEPEHQRAILAWAVRGGLDWRRNGMQTPTRVLEATSAHREAVSTVGRFLSECCSVARPGQEFSVDEAATLQQLHRAYIRWDRQQPAPERLQAAMFMQELGRQGYLLTKMWSRSGNESQRYQLIRLAATTEDPPF